MRWLAAATIVAVMASELIGCGDSDHPIEPGGSAGHVADGGSAGSGAHAGAGHAGAGHAGALNAGAPAAGESDAGSAGEGTAGAETSGAGGSVSGAGGSVSGAGGSVSGAGGSVAGAGGAAPSVPAAPTVFFAQIQGPTSILIRWSDNATDETGYYVYWSATAVKPSTPNATIAGDVTVSTNKNTIAEGLVSGTPYFFWIEAYNAFGSSSALMGTATAGPVPQLTSLQLIYPTSTQLSFTWPDVVGETGYHVYLATSPTQPPTPVHDLPANTVAFTFPVDEITPYTQYWVWVAAYNAIGDGLSVMRYALVGTPPAAPTSLSISVNVPSFTITGSWKAGSSNTSQYNVYWSDDDAKGLSTTVDGKTPTSTLKQVIGDRFYRLWVEAVNPAGTSYAVETIATTKTSDLSWRELWIDDNMQNVHLAVDDTFQFVSDGDPQTMLNVYQSGSSWPLDMGTPTALGPSGSVLWNVAALNIDVTRPHYFWAEAKKPEGTLFSMKIMDPGNPVTELVAAPSQTSVSLSWVAPPLIQKYLIYWSTLYFDQATLFGTTTTTNAIVTGLQPGTHYNFYVRSMRSALGGSGFVGDPVEVGATTTP